jgi:cytochrome c oxidase cbb3-type subunit III
MTSSVRAALMSAACLCAACARTPEATAVAAAPAVTDAGSEPQLAMPIGPIPGEPASTRLEQRNPFGTDPVAAMEGRRLFTSFNCAGCHGDHAGGGMGPSLRDERWLYGGTDANVAASIAQGRAHGMPSWGPKLTTEQVWKLATYVKSLRTPREPDQPAGN